MTLHGKSHYVCLPEEYKLLNQTGIEKYLQSYKRSSDVTYGENLVKHNSITPSADRQIKRMYII